MNELIQLAMVLATAGHALCSVRWYAIGDWGDPFLDIQDRVAAAMDLHAGVFHPEFILTQGDNFYQNGIHSLDDPKIDVLWRDMYNLTNLKDLPWWVAVGNHDYGFGLGEEWIQVELSEIEPLWNLPDLWHDFIRSDGEVSVHFIVIDTEALDEQLNNYTTMMEWLENKLNTTTSDWVIVNGHHPVYSCSESGPTLASMYRDLLPLLDRYKDTIDVFLAAHDHNVQLLQTIGDPDYFDFVISGAGGSLMTGERPGYDEILRDDYGINKTFMAVTGAFTAMEATPEFLNISFVDANVTTMYNYVRYKTADVMQVV